METELTTTHCGQHLRKTQNINHHNIKTCSRRFCFWHKAIPTHVHEGKKPEKAKWKFLQKYHHKGAFFMDDDTLAKAGEGDVRNRATDGAVLEDKFDRAALPKVMQVKDFGFQGRTKYTHLSDQDTTFVDRDNPMNGWLQRRHKADDPLRRGYDRRRGGTQDIDKAFERRRR